MHSTGKHGKTLKDMEDSLRYAHGMQHTHSTQHDQPTAHRNQGRH